MKNLSTKNKKQKKIVKPLDVAQAPMPLPAGITFISERKTSSDELKKSVQILTRTLSPEMKKIVEDALAIQGET